jgi:hypothetical protein
MFASVCTFRVADLLRSQRKVSEVLLLSSGYESFKRRTLLHYFRGGADAQMEIAELVPGIGIQTRIGVLTSHRGTVTIDTAEVC